MSHPMRRRMKVQASASRAFKASRRGRPGARDRTRNTEFEPVHGLLGHRLPGVRETGLPCAREFPSAWQRDRTTCSGWMSFRQTLTRLAQGPCPPPAATPTGQSLPWGGHRDITHRRAPSDRGTAHCRSVRRRTGSPWSRRAGLARFPRPAHRARSAARWSHGRSAPAGPGSPSRRPRVRTAARPRGSAAPLRPGGRPRHRPAGSTGASPRRRPPAGHGRTRRPAGTAWPRTWP